MLHRYFNLTKKSNFIGRLSHDLILFFDNLVVVLFGPPICTKLRSTELNNKDDSCYVGRVSVLCDCATGDVASNDRHVRVP